MQTRGRPQPPKDPDEESEGKAKGSEVPPEPLVVRDDLGVSAEAIESKAKPRCAYCHSDVLVAAMTCPGCATTLHPDCARRGGSCPTLGCDVPLKTFQRRRPSAAPRGDLGRRGLVQTFLIMLATYAAIQFGLDRVRDYRLDRSSLRDAAWFEHNADDVGDLTQALLDERAQVRVRAARALGALGPEAEASVPVLLASLPRDPTESALHSEVIDALQRIDGQGAVDQLLIGLPDAVGDHLRPGRVRALVELGLRNGRLEDVVAALEERGTSHPQHAAELSLVLAPYSSDAFLELYQVGLGQADVDLREAAARSLDEVSGPAQTGGIELALAHEDARVRWHAVRLLGPGAGTPSFWTQRLFDGTLDPSGDVRLAALQGLEAGGEAVDVEQRRETLTRLLADADPQVRQEASRQLALVTGAEASATFVALLDDGRITVCLEAIRVLEHMGDPRGLPPLERLAASPTASREVREAAAAAAQALANRPRTAERPQ